MEDLSEDSAPPGPLPASLPLPSPQVAGLWGPGSIEEPQDQNV